MTDNRNATDNRSVESAGGARPTTVAAPHSHTHSASPNGHPNCAICGELRASAGHNEVPAPLDSTVSREATGRLGEPFMATLWSIPHSDHRYPTVGDWQFRYAPDGCVRIDVQVSATADWRHAALIAVHELIEAILCRHRGISQDEVDEFDLAHPELADSGASESAPYHIEHMIAEDIERELAACLNVDWLDYTAALESLDD